MELLNELLSPLARVARENLYQISLIIIATLLVIYGTNINNLVRGMVSGFHFVVRVAAFIALVTVGYGAISVLLVPQLHKALAMLPNLWLPIAIASIFVLLGALIEKKKP